MTSMFSEAEFLLTMKMSLADRALCSLERLHCESYSYEDANSRILRISNKAEQ